MTLAHIVQPARVMPRGRYVGPAPRGGVLIAFPVSEPIYRPMLKERNA